MEYGDNTVIENVNEYDQRVCYAFPTYEDMNTQSIYAGISSTALYNKLIDFFKYFNFVVDIDKIYLEIVSYNAFLAIFRVQELKPRLIPELSINGMGYFVDVISKLYAESIIGVKHKKLWYSARKKKIKHISDSVRNVIINRLIKYTRSNSDESGEFAEGFGTDNSRQILSSYIVSLLPPSFPLSTAHEYENLCANMITYFFLSVSKSIRIEYYNDNKLSEYKSFPNLVDGMYLSYPELLTDRSVDPIWRGKSSERIQSFSSGFLSITHGIKIVHHVCKNEVYNCTSFSEADDIYKVVVKEVDAYASAAIRLCVKAGMHTASNKEIDDSLRVLDNSGFSDFRYEIYNDMPEKSSLVNCLKMDANEELILFGDFMWFSFTQKKTAQNIDFLNIYNSSTHENDENIKNAFFKIGVSIYEEILGRLNGEYINEYIKKYE